MMVVMMMDCCRGHDNQSLTRKLKLSMTMGIISREIISEQEEKPSKYQKWNDGARVPESG